MRIKKIISSLASTRPTTRATPRSAAVEQSNLYATSLYARAHVRY